MFGRYISRIEIKDELAENSYLRGIPVIRYLCEGGIIDFDKNVTFFVGENGTGKSTLLEAIAVSFGFNAEGGSKNFRFSTKETHSELWKHISVAKSAYPKDAFFLRAESFYNVATYIDELDEGSFGGAPLVDSYGGVSLHRQSHGESFISLIRNRFGGKGLYILDEPEAALSPAKQMALMAEINELAKKDSQFIIATHSPMLMTFPNACIYQLSQEKGLESLSYTQTEHYILTKQFLNNPDRMLKYLFEEE